jgi:hypothetical protein
MTKIAVLDDWQGIAESSTDWFPLMAVAHVVFFQQAFNDEDAVVRNLTDFEIVLTMRERTLLCHNHLSIHAGVWPVPGHSGDASFVSGLLGRIWGNRHKYPINK